MLATRKARATSARAFTSEEGTRPASIFTLDTQHSRIRAALNDGKDSLELPDDFVLHSLRHTFLSEWVRLARTPSPSCGSRVIVQ
jgi:integrase